MEIALGVPARESNDAVLSIGLGFSKIGKIFIDREAVFL